MRRSTRFLVALLPFGLLLFCWWRIQPSPEAPTSITANTASPEGLAKLQQVMENVRAGQAKKNFDKRAEGKAALDPGDPQRVALEALRKEVPDVQVEFDPITAVPKNVASTSQFLTSTAGAAAQGPFSYDDAMAKVKTYLNANRELFLHGGELHDAAKVSRQNTTEPSGLQTVEGCGTGGRIEMNSVPRQDCPLNA